MIPMLLVKVTALLALALLCLPLMRSSVFKTTAAVRHMVCAIALCGALLLPLTLAFGPKAIPVPVPVVFVFTAAGVDGASGGAFPFAGALLAVWALGVFALLLRLVWGYHRLTLVIQTAEPTAERSDVLLADVSVPLVCGLFRSSVLMPRAAVSWPSEQWAAALRHELAHLERRDLWTSLIANVACAAYWFHPLAWMLAAQLREEQEEACDDAVLFGGFEPATYAEALIATAKGLTSPHLIGCHMLTHRSLKNRIARLLDVNIPRAASAFARGRTALFSVGAITLIGLIYAQPQMDLHVVANAARLAAAATAPLPAVPLITPSSATRRYVALIANKKTLPTSDRDPMATVEPEKIYKVGSGISAPSVLAKVDPQYTEEARQAKIDGTVLLSIVIRPDGLAHDINIISSPDPGLGMKAVEAVQQWKFKPGMKDGEPVPVRAQIEVNFRIL